jgi:tetratricopeptide (TPR) repeat protein
MLAGGREAALQAAQLLREAVQLDPGFVRGWLALSAANGSAAILLPPAEAAGLFKESSEAVEKVRELAPDSMAARILRIRELVAQRQWAEADALTGKLLESTSLNAENLIELASSTGVLVATGRVNEVIRLAQRAKQLEPLSMSISSDLQRFLYAAGQFDAAKAENERSKTLPGDWSRSRGRALLLELRKENADPQVAMALAAPRANDEGLMLPVTVSMARVAGDRKAMQAALRSDYPDLSKPSSTQLVLVYQLADAARDRDLALSALERLLGQLSEYWPLWIAPDSGVRSDPRFKALLRESGLAEYFRTTGNWGDFCKPVGKDDFECQ